MAINYLRRVQARYQGQGQSDVSRGIAAGEAVGKLLGGLGTAIKGAQQDALANQLMNTQNAPRAALVNSGGPQPSQQGGTDSGDPDADLSTDLPENVSQAAGGSAPVLNQAVAAQRLSSPGTVDPNADLSTDLPDIVSPTQSVQVPASPSLGINTNAPASTTYSGTGTDPTIASNVAAAQLSSPQPSAQPTQPTVAPGVSTAGTKPYSGGVAGLSVLEKVQQMQAAKASAGSAQQEAALRLADMKAKATGTGPYALDAATKRAQLLAAQIKATQTPKTAVVKPEDIPINNINGEPVDNQGQLNKYIDKTWGTGSSGNIARTIMEPAMIPDPKGAPDPDHPGQVLQVPNPNGPQLSADGQTVTVGPKNKRITMPIGTAQTLVKQQNSLNYKQKQPLLRVPGEDQTQGSQANPYPINSKLDMVSRASGTWVRLPSGQIAQVP